MSYPRILTACRVSTRSGLNVDARSGSRFLSFPTLRGGADSFRHIRLPALYLLWTRRRSACAGEPPAATDSIGGSIRCAAEWLFFVHVCCCQHGRNAERCTRLGHALVRVERDQFWESVDRTLPAGDDHSRARCHSSDAPHGIPGPAYGCALRGTVGKFGGRGAYPDP